MECKQSFNHTGFSLIMMKMFGNTIWVKVSECKFYVMVPVSSAYLM